jgi:hypothetical protein
VSRPRIRSIKPEGPQAPKARYGKISTRMWGDEWFRSLSAPQPNGQTLWVHLLTGPHTLHAIPGLFMIGEAAMAEALGWPLEGFREAFREVSAKGKAKADWKARVIWVPKALVYNAPESPNVVKSWSKFFIELPECGLKDEAFHSLAVFVEGLGEGFREAFREAFLDPLGYPSRNHEHEHEHEHEEKLSPPAEARTALLPDDAGALEAEAVEVPRVGSARSAGAARVVAAAAAAPDLAATVAAPPAAPGRHGHLKVVKPEPTEFTAFYEIYSRKTARAEALKAWVKLKPDAALVAQIMAAVEVQKAPAPKPGNTLAPTDGPAYIPYPASWLNGKRWTDEIIPAAPAEGSTTSPAQPLLAEFGRLFEAKVMLPYVANVDRDLKILEELLAQRNGRGEIAFPPATLQRLMRGFFKYPPPWVRERDRFDVPTFKTVFPELTRMLSKGDI